MGQEPNRLKIFGAFLQGLERGKNLPPPSLAATTGERELITKVEENESSSLDNVGYNRCHAKA